MEQFESFIGLSSEEFFSQYYRKQHLYVPRRADAAFESILSIEDLELALSTVPFEHGQINFANKEGKPAWEDVLKVRKAGNRIISGGIDLQKLLEQLRRGSTAIFNDLSPALPKLADFCEKMEAEWKVRFQANIYVTPPNSQGFGTHPDSHDVFIIQVAGKKSWRLYEGILENPSLASIGKMKEFSQSKHPIKEELVMNVGDVLYIPQGMYHDADTLDEASVHITVGNLPERNSRILTRMVEKELENGYFRKSVPLHFQDAEKMEEFEKEFRAMCHRLIDEADLGALLWEGRNKVGKHSRLISGELKDALNFKQLGPKSRLQRRTGTTYEQEQRGFYQVLTVRDVEIKILLPMLGILDKVLSYEPFELSELTSQFGEIATTEVVGKMVSSGLLQILEV